MGNILDIIDDIVDAGTPVEWVQNGNGQYEISSLNHLVQVMTQGGNFNDTGTIPPNYMTSSFLQTTDIDAANDGDITTIGTQANPFTGSYDGGSFTIFNIPLTPGTPLIYLSNGAIITRMNIDGILNINGTIEINGETTIGIS